MHLDEGALPQYTASLHLPKRLVRILPEHENIYVVETGCGMYLDESALPQYTASLHLPNRLVRILPEHETFT